MPEYINKQQTLEKAKTLQGETFGSVLIVNEIEKTDGIDIVFCKECKYHKTHTCAITGEQTIFCDYSTTHEVVEPTHYCSYEKRGEK